MSPLPVASWTKRTNRCRLVRSLRSGDGVHKGVSVAMRGPGLKTPEIVADRPMWLAVSLHGKFPWPEAAPGVSALPVMHASVSAAQGQPHLNCVPSHGVAWRRRWYKGTFVYIRGTGHVASLAACPQVPPVCCVAGRVPACRLWDVFFIDTD